MITEFFINFIFTVLNWLAYLFPAYTTFEELTPALSNFVTGIISIFALATSVNSILPVYEIYLTLSAIIFFEVGLVVMYVSMWSIHMVIKIIPFTK